MSAATPSAPIPSNRAKSAARWIALFIAFVPTGIAAFYITKIVQNRQQLRDGKLDLGVLAYTEGVKKAAEQKVDAAKGTFQNSLIVLAALWGLFLAKKKDERYLSFDRFDDLPENVIFWLVTLILIGGWFCHTEYTESMAVIHTRVTTPGSTELPPPPHVVAVMAGPAAAWGYTSLPPSSPGAAPEPRIPDFLDPAINEMTVWQTYLLAIGVVMAGWVLFSCHLLKENRP